MKGDENCCVSGKLHKVTKDNLFPEVVSTESSDWPHSRFFIYNRFNINPQSEPDAVEKTVEDRLRVSVGVPLQMFRKDFLSC